MVLEFLHKVGTGSTMDGSRALHGAKSQLGEYDCASQCNHGPGPRWLHFRALLVSQLLEKHFSKRNDENTVKKI